MLLNYRDAGSVCSLRHDFTGELMNVQHQFLFCKEEMSASIEAYEKLFFAGWIGLSIGFGRRDFSFR
jgi:hypothetical protein